MLPTLQSMINYLKFERNINPGARKFARGLEYQYYFKKDLSARQITKLVEIYNEKIEERH